MDTSFNNKCKLLVICMLLNLLYITRNYLWFNPCSVEVQANTEHHFGSGTSEPKPSDIFKVKMNPDLIKLINPSTPKFDVAVNGSYILENENHCASVQNLTILILVLSAPKNFKMRSAIRDTWANNYFYSSYGTAKVLFLLGMTINLDANRLIKKEFELHEDILQGSFIDSYQNLSHKSVMGFKWVTERCRNAKYILKTDDDIVINMFRVLQSVHLLSLKQYHIQCRRFTDSVIERTKGSKFYVEPNQLKGLLLYPAYCSGQFVMMLNDLVPYLYESASESPLFWIDDVFVYGIALNNIPAVKYIEDVTYTDSKSLFFWIWEKPKCRYMYFVTGNSREMTEIWSAIVKQYL